MIEKLITQAYHETIHSYFLGLVFRSGGLAGVSGGNFPHFSAFFPGFSPDFPGFLPPGGALGDPVYSPKGL